MAPEYLLILWTGLLAGGVHVFAGADHLAALLPLSVGRSWRAWLLGARWGIGHSAGVLVVGGLAVAFKEQLNVELVSEWGERLVGVMLIGIGALGLRWAFKTRLHVHTHRHDGREHQHLHVHTAEPHKPGRAHAPSHRHGHTAFFAGILHGTAGTSHLLGVLPAVGMADWMQSGVYLAMFAAGTILAMSIFTAVIGGSSARLGERGPRMISRLMFGASCLTIGVGVAWLILPMIAPGAH